jgi:hypothetical protein
MPLVQSQGLKGVWVSRHEVELQLAQEQQQRLITAGISITLIDVMYDKSLKREDRDRAKQGLEPAHRAMLRAKPLSCLTLADAQAACVRFLQPVTDAGELSSCLERLRCRWPAIDSEIQRLQRRAVEAAAADAANGCVPQQQQQQQQQQQCLVTAGISTAMMDQVSQGLRVRGISQRELEAATAGMKAAHVAMLQSQPLSCLTLQDAQVAFQHHLRSVVTADTLHKATLSLQERWPVLDKSIQLLQRLADKAARADSCAQWRAVQQLYEQHVRPYMQPSMLQQLQALTADSRSSTRRCARAVLELQQQCITALQCIDQNGAADTVPSTAELLQLQHLATTMESAVAALSSAARMQLKEGEVHVTALSVQASATTSESSGVDSGSGSSGIAIVVADATSAVQRVDTAVGMSLKPLATAVTEAAVQSASAAAAVQSKVTPTSKAAVLKKRKKRVTFADTVTQGEPKRARRAAAKPAAVAPVAAVALPCDAGTVQHAA